MQKILIRYNKDNIDNIRLYDRYLNTGNSVYSYEQGSTSWYDCIDRVDPDVIFTTMDDMDVSAINRLRDVKKNITIFVEVLLNSSRPQYNLKHNIVFITFDYELREKALFIPPCSSLREPLVRDHVGKIHKSDALFIGNYNKTMDKVLGKLITADQNVKIFGHGWPRWFEAYNDQDISMSVLSLIQSAKVCIFERESNNLFEAVMMGGHCWVSNPTEFLTNSKNLSVLTKPLEERSSDYLGKLQSFISENYYIENSIRDILNKELQKQGAKS